jgi:ribose transport system substrate-binding protein
MIRKFSQCGWALAVLAMVSLGFGCTSSKTGPGTTSTFPQGGGGAKRLILLTNGNSPFWDACRSGLVEGAKHFDLQAAGLTAVMEVNDGSPQGQINKLRQFGSQTDVACVAVSAVDADNAAVAQEMQKLRKKGIHVICVDADINREKFPEARAYYIGTDNLAGGRVLGTAAKHLLEARDVTSGSFVQFVGRTGSDNARKRMNGFQEAVGSQYRDADRMGDDFDRTKARENVRNAINNHKDLVALVGIWSYNAPAIVDVVKEKNARDEFTIVTFDAEPIAVTQMGQGQIDAMVVQNPFDMGYQAVRLLKALYQDDSATVEEMFPDGGDVYITGLKVVVPDDKSPLKAEMFKENTEFMTLATFRTWLQKYNLQGS